MYAAHTPESNVQMVPSTVVRNTVHPVAALWEKKGVSFPGKGIIPNSVASTKSDTSASATLYDGGLDPRLDLDGLDPDEREEELNTDYGGLALLFRAANMNRD